MENFVFLSHDARDKALVETLAHALLDAGIEPWLDKWHLTAGKSWQVEIARAIQQASAVAVCLGPHGLGKVQVPEIEVALAAAWRDPERLVMPVLLPGFSGDVPTFLAQRTWVDLRQGITDLGVAPLVAALRGHASGPERQEGETSPYRALDPFEEEHSSQYFGRQREVEMVLQRLQGSLESGLRLLSLVAASGAGKSSLLKAGLLPAVRTGQLDHRYDWSLVTLRPGPRPVHELAVHLARLEGVSPARLEQIGADLLARTNALSDYVDLLLAEDSARLLLAVDQFEEVFIQATRAEEARAFVANLLDAASTPGGRTLVVITLRADFLGQALSFSPELAAALKTSEEILLPMGPDGLREAVIRPAHQFRLRFDDGLADALGAAVEGQPGALPLLQFTLDALYKERHGHRLTWESYRRLGGVRGAIASRADGFLNRLDQPARETVRRLFGRMVHLGDGTADTRRLAHRNELDAVAPEASSLVDRLIGERLLTAREDGIEVAHEALIDNWPTLEAWLREDRADLRLQEDLADAAHTWEDDGRPDHDLWRGGRLVHADELIHSGRVRPSPSEKEFIQRSKQVEQGEQAEKLRAAVALAQSKALAARRLKVGLGAALVLLGAAATLAVVAGRQSRLAEQRLVAALETANFIVEAVDRKLMPLAGAGSLRRELLEAGAKLLGKLEDGGASQQLQSRRVYHLRRGDLAFEQENLERAHLEYTRAIEIARQLLAREPSNADAKRALAVSLTKLGEWAMRSKDLAAARGFFTECQGLRRELSRAERPAPQDQRDLAVSLLQMGDVEVRAGNLARAKALFEESYRICIVLAQADPEGLVAQRDLFIRLDRLGSVAAQLGDLASARPYLEQSLKITQKLVLQHPDDVRLQRDLSVSLERLGNLAVLANDLPAARRFFEQSLDLDRKLARAEPESAQSKSDLATSLEKLGDLAERMDDLPAARHYFEQTLEIRVALSTKDQENRQLKRDLSITLGRVGSITLKEGNPAATLGFFQQALDIRRKLALADPESGQAQLDLAISYFNVAQVLDRTGEMGASRNHLEIGEALMDKLRAEHRFEGDAEFEMVAGEFGRFRALLQKGR